MCPGRITDAGVDVGSASTFRVCERSVALIPVDTLSAASTLTVSAVSDASDPAPWFEVSLIPETLEVTTLGVRRPGDLVNLETDILARHVQRLLAFAAPTSSATDVPESTETPEGGSR